MAEAAPKAPGTPRKKAVIAGPKKSAEVKSAQAQSGQAKSGQAKSGRAKKTAANKLAPDQLTLMQTLIVTSLDDDKAEDIVVLDLAGRASFADRMVIATGLADRQIAAMATHLIEKLAEIGVKRVQTEGASGSDWVLVDAGDIVVHLFKADARALYALEKMWGADLDDPV